MKAFTVLFIAHLLGDYYFQPEALAEKKNTGAGWVLLHCLIYAAASALCLLLLGGGFIWAAAAAAGAHFLIDLIKKLVIRKPLSAKSKRTVFAVDQSMHLLSILAASIWVTESFELAVPPYMDGLARITGLDSYTLLSYIALALAVMKPANVLIRIMLAEGRQSEASVYDRMRTGRLIGSLERLLVTALLVLGQYSSIALVFTAKSIARFKQLENRDFAEYYLFGTLLSASVAVGAFVLMKFFGTL